MNEIKKPEKKSQPKKHIPMKIYGKELILDLHECDTSTFTRQSLKEFFTKLCRIIDMTPEKLVWWDDLHVRIKDRKTEPHLKGTSAVQFITTSNITIHTLDILAQVHLNIFSCKDFDSSVAAKFSRGWFNGNVVACATIERV